MAEESGSIPKGPAEVPVSASPYRAPEETKAVTRQTRILLAEDNTGDVLLVREALSHHGIDAELTVQRDGEEMYTYIDRIEAGEILCPDLILLDLNLPKRTGETLLARLKETKVCRDVPVVIITSSNAQRDRERVAALGARGYFRKPSDYDEFMTLGGLIGQLLGRGEI